MKNFNQPTHFLLLAALGFFSEVMTPSAFARLNLPEPSKRVEADRIQNIRDFKIALMTLPADRSPTLIEDMGQDDLLIRNIVDGNQLFQTRVRPSQITNIYIYNVPLPLGQFHFSAGFEFRQPLQLMAQDKSGKKISTRILVMGTGPTISMSMGAMVGTHNISMRTKSLEQLQRELPSMLQHQRTVNQNKVDPQRLLYAFAEEASRTYFLQQLRVSLIDLRPETSARDSFKIGRYTVLAENCVSSGVRNFSMALSPQYYEQILSHPTLKKDISSFKGVMSEQTMRRNLKLWFTAAKELDGRLARQLNQRNNTELFAQPLDLSTASSTLREAVEVAKEHAKGIGSTENRVALPTRARAFINFMVE
jgi:hypothetical protein